MENNQSEPSFEELLKESESRNPGRLSPGQKLLGKIVHSNKESVFVDIGKRSEAIITKIEGDTRFDDLKEGQEIEVFVTKPGEVCQLSLDPIMGFGDIDAVAKAHEAGETVEGKIVGANKGGFEVNISGVRAFCPMSQMDVRPVDNQQEWLNQTHEFSIIEFDADRENVVVSRRALLEAELNRKIEALRENLVPGKTVTGKVVDIRPFGAFIDLGGLTGMVHISELAHQKTARVEDVLSMDEEIKVQILKIETQDNGKERIALSIKALLPDPWNQVNPQIGQTMTAKVARKSRFGLFMELSPGLDGLLPFRLMKKDGVEVNPDEIEEGDSLEVEITEVHPGDRKITLALPGWDKELKSRLKPGDPLTAEVVKVIHAGVIVQCTDDPAKGLIPKRMLKEGSMKAILNKYEVGSQHQVVLEEIDERGRYTFSPKKAGEGVDEETIDEFVNKEEDLGHNPFAAFFNKKDN